MMPFVEKFSLNLSNARDDNQGVLRKKKYSREYNLAKET